MFTGMIRDLLPRLGEETVHYSLVLDKQEIPLNPLIGREVKLSFTGERRCVHCGRKSNKLFNNGSCWPCFQNLAVNDMCQVKPHLCHYETCREQAWGDAHCMIPTYVYLAKSSDIKVGITRNVPGRWMDQGAVEAIPIALVPTRKMAGELELFLSNHLQDKTNWRKMLKGEVVETPILEVRERILGLIPDDYRGYLLQDEPVRNFAYPVTELPEKIASHDIEKAPAEGRLLGIKGSYLILNTGVLNVPKFSGYLVSFEAPGAAEAAAG
ncbi:MAG: DUF2797 domain-containing protein [Bacillota bacterium]